MTWASNKHTNHQARRAHGLTVDPAQQVRRSGQKQGPPHSNPPVHRSPHRAAIRSYPSPPRKGTFSPTGSSAILVLQNLKLARHNSQRQHINQILVFLTNLNIHPSNITQSSITPVAAVAVVFFIFPFH